MLLLISLHLSSKLKTNSARLQEMFTFVAYFVLTFVNLHCARPCPPDGGWNHLARWRPRSGWWSPVWAPPSCPQVRGVTRLLHNPGSCWSCSQSCTSGGWCYLSPLGQSLGQMGWEAAAWLTGENRNRFIVECQSRWYLCKLSLWLCCIVSLIFYFTATIQIIINTSFIDTPSYSC